MAEPKYITELKNLYHGMDKHLTRIDGKLEVLPDMERHLKELNSKVQGHDVSIAKHDVLITGLEKRQEKQANPKTDDNEEGLWGMCKYIIGRFGIPGLLSIMVLVCLIIIWKLLPLIGG